MHHHKLMVVIKLLLCSLVFVGNASALEAKPTKTSTVLANPLVHLGFAGKDVSAWTLRAVQAAKDIKAETDKIYLRGAITWTPGQQIVWQAAKNNIAETFKIDLTGANEWIHKASANVEDAIDHMDTSDFGKWFKQASHDIGLNATLANLQAVRLEDLPADAIKYIKDNPKQTAFYIVEGVVFFSPATVYGPLLYMLGFGAEGVRADMCSKDELSP